jgi:hypothetical protein
MTIFDPQREARAAFRKVRVWQPNRAFLGRVESAPSANSICASVRLAVIITVHEVRRELPRAFKPTQRHMLCAHGEKDCGAVADEYGEITEDRDLSGPERCP